MTRLAEYCYPIGQRVVVCYQFGPNGAKVGAKGTVIECDPYPWVAFDEPTGFDDSVYTEACKIPGWKPGHMDCAFARYLESIEDEDG